MRTLDRKTICGIMKWYKDAMAELSAEYNARWEQADGNVDAIKAANAWYDEQEDKLRVEHWERVERALDEASEKPAPAEREESKMLKFYRVDYATEERKEITHEKALDIVLGTFRDCDMTHDMLTLPNRIKCRYSQIDVESVDEAGRVMVAMPGCYNLVPIDARYDEETGKRF